MNRMKQNIARDAENYMKNHRKKGRWYKLVTGLACIVVFCTTYALILPAITLEGNQCGIEEHTHTDECYTQVTSITRKVPVCTVEGLDIHVHSEKCYDDQKNLICGYADFVAHKHDASCYREDGTLWCPLEEREPHVHDASCYTLPEPHVHTDECYTTERGELTCTEHVHTDECYTETTGLTCGLEESEAHHHDDSCHDAEGNLVCGQEESEGHHHSESCYGPVRTLTCGYEGDHQHTDACYEQKQVLTCELSTDPVTEPVLVCDKEEILLHTHTDECYDKDGKRICGQVEIKEHQHTDACFREEEEPVDTETLTCTLPEDENHTHTARCYGTWELTCGMEEHTHTLACYADPEADLETEADWKQTFANLTLTGKWREDLLSLAKTQLDYAESERNYIVLEDGETAKGYTRYGAWQDDPYMDWNAAFVSFCLHYAGVTEIPVSVDCAGWPGALGEQYAPADAREPVPGDLVFFDRDSDGSADHVGILLEVTEGTEEAPAVLTTIEGDAENAVRKADYPSGDPTVLGYGILPEQARTFTLTATTESGITVTVSGDSASLPCLAGDVNVVVRELDEKERQEIEAQLAGNEEQKESEVRYLLDISLRRGENEIEPVGPVNVTFSDLDMEGPYSKVYHIDTEENVVTDMAAVKDEDGNISMETNHFSIYMLADEVTPEGTAISGDFAQSVFQNGGTFYLSGAAYTGGTISITQDTTLDLNGCGLYYQGSGNFFEVKNGATLTIIDSKPASNTPHENESGILYGRVASVAWSDAGVSDQTFYKPSLTYYVTESTANGTGTTEALKKHEVTGGGHIVATNATSIVKVEGGCSFTLQGGMLSIKNDLSNGAHIIQNYGTLNLNGGYVCGGQGDTIGAGIYSTGSIDMSGSVVAANYGTSGGGIFMNGGSLTMSDGAISGNTASRNSGDNGGGIFAEGGATISIQGGYITNNSKGIYCGADGNGCHGGGGIATYGGTLNISGGYITGNYSAEAGGGLYVGQINGATTTFTMSGGYVASNVAQYSEGGGIRISKYSSGIISGSSANKVYITNNKTNSPYDWGGGGIFVQEFGTLQIFNSLITENKAGGFGAGVGACPTGTTTIAANNGAAIYDNRAAGTTMSDGGHGKVYDTEAQKSDIFMNNGDYDDFFCVRDSSSSGTIAEVSGGMLGGNAANWRGSCDNESITIDESAAESATFRFGLTAYPDGNAKSAAQQVAGVVISKNESITHGGGIMTNGGLVIGSRQDSITPLPSLKITGTKVLKVGDTPQNSGRDFKFQLWDSTEKKVVGTATADATTGEFTISPNETYAKEGTYTYYLKEFNDGREGVTYDSEKYKIDVKIAKKTYTEMNTTYTTYYVESVTVNDQTSGSGGSGSGSSGSTGVFRIHFNNAQDWDQVKLYLFGSNPSNLTKDTTYISWPGKELTKGTYHAGWYTAEFNIVQATGSFQFLFNNPNRSIQTVDSTSYDIEADKELWVTCTGHAYDNRYNMTVEDTKPDDSWPDPPSSGGGEGPNPSITGSGFEGHTNEDGSYTVKLKGDTFTNHKTETISTNLKLVKKDSNDTNKLLNDATFHLKKSDGEYDQTVTTSGTGVNAGVALFEGLEEGTYWLWETQAPPNYYKAGPWVLQVQDGAVLIYPATEKTDGALEINGTPETIKGTGTNPIVLTYEVEDRPFGYELPNTGGTGTELYTLGGLLLIAAAGLLAYYQHKRRKEDFASF